MAQLNYTRHRTAIHEAAHSVVVLAGGGLVGKVSIKPSADGATLGRMMAPIMGTKRGKPPKFTWRGQSIDTVVMCVAGGVAERIRFGADAGGCVGDNQQALQEAREVALRAGFTFVAEPAQEIVALARSKAERLLRVRWLQVIRLTHALLSREELLIDQVDEAVRDQSIFPYRSRQKRMAPARSRRRHRLQRQVSRSTTSSTAAAAHIITAATARTAFERSLFDDVHYREGRVI